MSVEPRNAETPQAVMLEISGIVLKALALAGIWVVVPGMLFFDLVDDYEKGESFGFDWYQGEVSVGVASIVAWHVGKRLHDASYYKRT